MVKEGKATRERFKHLYGPVPSRRLGRSLGVDLVPHKVCTYDCVYCQIGKTTEKTSLRKEYVPEEEILEEIKTFLDTEDASKVDHITLGGSGEPTLHLRIGSIVRRLKEMTSIPVAVITNGALLWEEEVRNDLLDADVVLPSLDAVSPDVFGRINRPFFGIRLEKVIDGLVRFRQAYQGQIWLEILFCKGINDGPDELQRMKRVVERIHPDQIHLNTVVRPPSESFALPLTEEEMEGIRRFFGEKAKVISEFSRHSPIGPSERVSEEILNTLRRRPLSLPDLSLSMGLSKEELETCLNPLVREGRVRTRVFGDVLYYEAMLG